jgi:hypothetical protein
MPNTMKLIESYTVGSGGIAGITFSSIPQTYTDLLIKVSFRTNRAEANDYLMIRFNSSSSGYTDRNLGKSAATVLSETNNSTTYGFAYGINGNTATSGAFGTSEIYISNYNTSANKCWSHEGATEQFGTSNQIALTAGLWADSSAITSIYLASHDTSKTLLQHSTAYLYGIVKQ